VGVVALFALVPQSAFCDAAYFRYFAKLCRVGEALAASPALAPAKAPSVDLPRPGAQAGRQVGEVDGEQRKDEAPRHGVVRASPDPAGPWTRERRPSSLEARRSPDPHPPGAPPCSRPSAARCLAGGRSRGGRAPSGSRWSGPTVRLAPAGAIEGAPRRHARAVRARRGRAGSPLLGVAGRSGSLWSTGTGVGRSASLWYTGVDGVNGRMSPLPASSSPVSSFRRRIGRCPLQRDSAGLFVQEDGRVGLHADSVTRGGEPRPADQPEITVPFVDGLL
jgi:hypothetical protein